MLRAHEKLPAVLISEPKIHPDNRGTFHEWFKASQFEEATGFPFDLQQANISTSKAGVVRGMHFADVPPGQAKFVSCLAGRIIDVVVDVRVGSETFGTVIAVELDAERHTSVYVPNGFAHGFQALTDATVAYLTSAEYNPAGERGCNPLDAELGIAWPVAEPILSEKDRGAPSLAELKAEGLLPQLDDCESYETELRDGWAMANEAAGEPVA